MAVADSEPLWLQGKTKLVFQKYRFLLFGLAIASVILFVLASASYEAQHRRYDDGTDALHAAEVENGGVESQSAVGEVKNEGVNNQSEVEGSLEAESENSTTSAIPTTTRSPNPEFQIYGYPPQPTKGSRYKDDVILTGPGPEDAPVTELGGLRYAVLLPTFEGHFDNAIMFFQSLKCLCTDIEDVDIHVIVSDSEEALAFRDRMASLGECGETFSRFKTPAGNVGRPNPIVDIVNLYDILPDNLKKKNGIPWVFPNSTVSMLEEHGKYKYQSIKKLAAARTFEYDYALWLDSEAVAVHPFSIRETFDQWVERPVIFRSRKGDTNGFHAGQINDAARTLGRSINSVGPAFWGLESIQWFIEKAVIDDMFQYVHDAQQADFYDAWLRNGGPFEILVYNMHIHQRKLETVDSVYSKYTFLETEREMIRFGLVPGFVHMENWDGVGFLERSHVMFRDHDELQPNFSAFLRQNNQRLYRIDDIDVLRPEVMDRFLLETPVDLICSSAPDLHRWWSNRMSNGEDFGGTLAGWDGVGN